MFTQGYYEGEPDQPENEQDYIKSPFATALEGQNELHKHDAVTYGEGNQQQMQGGILNNYRKVTGTTVEDALEGDYWRANRDIQHQAAKFFNHVSSSEQDMMNNTKNFTMRHRLNRDLDFSDDFRRKYMTKEYGNYQKYEKNSVETVYDEGVEESTTDKLYENYMRLIRTLPTGEAEEMEKTKRDDIRDMLTDQSETHKTFADRYFKKQT